MIIQEKSQGNANEEEEDKQEEYQEQNFEVLQMKSQYTRHEFLFVWFEMFHFSNGWQQYEFSSTLLFNDRYLLQILSTGLPNDFDVIDENDLLSQSQSVSAQQQQMVEKREEKNCELKLFSSLKQFFKEREVDLTEVLKLVRTKKQANKNFDFQAWEKAYWQLIYIIFTAFYIENSQHEFIENYFQVQIRADLKQMKMVLDIISSVLRRSQTPEIQINPMACSQQQNIIILDSPAEATNLVNTNPTLSLQNQSQHYVVQVSDKDFLRNLTESSEGSLGTQEDDEDDLLKEDISTWDVFDDYNKFQLRESKIKEKIRKEALGQRMEIEKQKKQEIDQEAEKNLELELERFENKMKVQEETIKRKNDKEQALLNELNVYESKVQMKQLEIENLHQKMLFYETFKHKFDVKKMESERLLTRVEELSHINGSLEEQIVKQGNKNFRLSRDIDDLKEKIKLIKNNSSVDNELSCLDDSKDYKNPSEVKINIKGLVSRVESPQELSIEEQKSANSNQAPNDNSLQQELFIDQPSQQKVNFKVNFNTKPSYEDEEIFDGQNSFRSQYRFETTEDDLAQQHNNSDIVSRHENYEYDMDPDTMDSELLKQEYSREQLEKAQYRKLYLELQERCFHYQQMMQEYERLYTEFLTKSIKAEKDKKELQMKLSRINWLSNFFACGIIQQMNCRKYLYSRRRRTGSIMILVFTAAFIIILMTFFLLLS